MTAAATLLAIVAYLALVLLVARCCGINSRLDPEPTAMTDNDIHQAAEGAVHALRRVAHTCQGMRTQEIPQQEGRALIERAYADLAEYQGMLVSYAATLTTPPPYYPGHLESDLAAARHMSPPTRTPSHPECLTCPPP